MARPALVPQEPPVQTVTIEGKEYIPLPQPETAADLTAGEMREAEAINAVVDRLTADVVHAQRVLGMATAHRLGFYRSLLEAKSLPSPDDLYSVSLESGTIMRTHLAVPVAPDEG